MTIEREYIEEVVSSDWLGANRSRTEFTNSNSEARVILVHSVDGKLLTLEVDEERVYQNEKAIVGYLRKLPETALGEEESLRCLLSLRKSVPVAEKKKPGRKPLGYGSISVNGAAHV